MKFSWLSHYFLVFYPHSFQSSQILLYSYQTSTSPNTIPIFQPLILTTAQTPRPPSINPLFIIQAANFIAQTLPATRTERERTDIGAAATAARIKGQGSSRQIAGAIQLARICSLSLSLPGLSYRYRAAATSYPSSFQNSWTPINYGTRGGRANLVPVNFLACPGDRGI